MGLGSRDAFDPERARVAAAAVHGRARELGTRVLAWELPHHVPDEVASALVEGTILAAYRFDRYRARPEDEPRDVQEIVVSSHHDVAAAVERGAIGADAQNFARDLQDTPANDLTPTALAERAQQIEGIEVEVHGRDWMAEQGMGALLAVAQGSDQEPAVIVARYDGGGDGPAARARRQGRHPRHRRPVDQAGGRHARDEVRHVRRRGGARSAAGDRRPRAARARARRRRLDGEHHQRRRR